MNCKRQTANGLTANWWPAVPALEAAWATLKMYNYLRGFIRLPILNFSSRPETAAQWAAALAVLGERQWQLHGHGRRQTINKRPNVCNELYTTMLPLYIYIYILYSLSLDVGCAFPLAKRKRLRRRRRLRLRLQLYRFKRSDLISLADFLKSMPPFALPSCLVSWGRCPPKMDAIPSSLHLVHLQPTTKWGRVCPQKEINCKLTSANANKKVCNSSYLQFDYLYSFNNFFLHFILTDFVELFLKSIHYHGLDLYNFK